MIDTSFIQLIEDNTTATSLYRGKIDPSHDFADVDPVVNVVRLPSATFNWWSGNSLTSFQISIRSKSISTARSMAEEIHDFLNGWTGYLDSAQVAIRFESDGGELYEADGDIVHIPLTYVVRHVR